MRAGGGQLGGAGPPDNEDATIAKASIAIGSLGNARIETLSAFTEDQYRDLVGQLP